MADVNLGAWFRGLVDDIDNAVEEVSEYVADEGVKRTKQKIETRGTGNSWAASWDSMPNATPGRHSSSPGRDATGQMKNDVTGQVVNTGRSIETSFGWIDNYENYYGAQENGFNNMQANKKVEGMYALSDTAFEIINEAEKRLDVILRAL